MEIASHIEQLKADGARMAETIGMAKGLDAPVPSCPDWILGDLVGHQGAIHRWATAFVSGGITDPGQVDFEALRQSNPGGEGLASWFIEGHAALVSALEEADGDVECFTFMAAPSPLAFWARRQAHETAIHRLDTELTAGVAPTMVAPVFASDGIDEMLRGFLPRRHKSAVSPVPLTLLVLCSDTSRSWRVTMGPDGLVCEVGVGVGGDSDGAECSVMGPACDLYYALWNRCGLGALSVEGNPEVIDELLGRTQLR
ncbi:MAG TPA: maleylpyruvate isomerase family mycothiol-dependent enzyme [Acidimicrobiales bacterium]|jgi:uncharacterized protein (TIGR03083 family)